MMGIDELMDLTMYSSMYLLFYMAYFYVEGANLLVPCQCQFQTDPVSFCLFLQRFHRRRGMESICCSLIFLRTCFLLGLKE